MKAKTKRVLAIMVALLALAVSPVRGAVDAFLKIGDIKGETLDVALSGSSDVFSWSWGLNHPLAIDGTTASKVTFHALTVQKRFDTATPVLLQAAASGGRHPRATLTLRKRGQTTVEFARIVMEDVNVAGILIGLSRDGDGGDETLSLTSARVGVEYFTILADGKPGERKEFAWDILANKPGASPFQVRRPRTPIPMDCPTIGNAATVWIQL